MRAKNLMESFKFASQGLAYSFKTQRNFRIHCLATIALLLLLLLIEFALWEFLFLLSAAFAVLITELFNTSIEKTIDLYTSKFHPLAKIAKNCAAAAVLMAAVYAFIVGLVVILPRFMGMGR